MEQARPGEFLRRLLACAGPSGCEDEVDTLFREYLAPFTGRTWGEVVGNAYAVVNEGASMKVMVTGHADEIGMQVTHIDESGFLRFRSIGSPRYAAWIGGEWRCWAQRAGCRALSGNRRLNRRRRLTPMNRPCSGLISGRRTVPLRKISSGLGIMRYRVPISDG